MKKSVLYTLVLLGLIPVPVASAQTLYKTATFEGKDGQKVTLPIEPVQTQYGIGDGKQKLYYPTKPIPPFHFTIPPNQVNQLAVYWMYGWYQYSEVVIGPRGWTATGGIGADGTSGITLTDPNNKKDKLNFWQDAEMQAALAYDTSYFFPDQRKYWVSSGQALPPAGKSDVAHRYMVNSHTVAFQLKNGTNGVATYTKNPYYTFQAEQILMPKSDNALETTTLNFFHQYIHDYSPNSSQESTNNTTKTNNTKTTNIPIYPSDLPITNFKVTYAGNDWFDVTYTLSNVKSIPIYNIRVMATLMDLKNQPVVSGWQTINELPPSQSVRNTMKIFWAVSNDTFGGYGTIKVLSAYPNPPQ